MANNLFRRFPSGRLQAEAFIKKPQGTALKTIVDGFWQVTVVGTSYTKGLSGSIGITGSLLKLIKRSILGSITGSGVINKAITRLVSSSITMTSPLSRLTTKATPLVGSITPSATLLSQTFIGKALAGSLTISGLIVNRAITRSLSGLVTATGSVNKLVTRSLTGSLTMSSLIAKRIARTLLGNLTLSATFASNLTATRVLVGTLQAIGTFISTYIPLVVESSTDTPNTPSHIRRFQGRR